MLVQKHVSWSKCIYEFAGERHICMSECLQWRCCAPEGFPKRLTVLPPHHDAVVDEALAVAGGLEMGILFSAGDPNVPHTSPSLVQLQVHWVDPWVVRSHCVTHVHRDVVLLQGDMYVRVIYINAKYSTFTTLTRDTVAHKDRGRQSDLVEEAHGLCLLRCWPSGWKLKKYIVCVSADGCWVHLTDWWCCPSLWHTPTHTLSKLSISDQTTREVSMYVWVQQRLGIALYDHVHLQQHEPGHSAALYTWDSTPARSYKWPPPLIHTNTHRPTNYSKPKQGRATRWLNLVHRLNERCW